MATPSLSTAYSQIFKSTALIGGSSVISLAIGVLRTKVVAAILGPAGVGLMGIYGSIIDLAHSLAGMGIRDSGVRQIAEAAGSNDRLRIARTAAVLRRVAIALGALGAVLLVALAVPVAKLTFGDRQHATAIALLSVAVFFRLVSAGQGALIQGMRRISDIARLNVIGAALGTIVTVPILYFFREQGIVPSLVAVAAVTLATTWWYSRKVDVSRGRVPISHFTSETVALLKLGLAFMASGILMMGSAYANRIIVLHEVGVEATGLYQVAWNVSGIYVGFILQAMGADFYPRLVASAADNATCNRLVNEQTQVGLLLGGPGAIATLTFSPIIVPLLYSPEFTEAVDVLRWLSLGLALRIITWPIGFIILAKGRQDLFFASEVAWTIVNVSLTWMLVNAYGVNGAGMAFLGSYVFHGLIIYPTVNRLSGFGWSAANARTGLLLLSMTGVVFAGFYLLPPLWAVALGASATVASAVYSIRVLLVLLWRNGAGGALSGSGRV